MSIHGIFHRIDSRRNGKGSILQSLLPVLFLVPAAAFMVSACQKEEKAAPPPPAVEVVEVTAKDVPMFAEWVGTLDGLVNAVIRAQVQGYLVKQNYQEGDVVRQGHVLFEIDPREFQAAVNQARGTLAQTKAALEKAKADVALQEARWNMAKANLGRVRPLAQQNAVSQKDLDDAVGNELSGRSSVEAAKAAVVAEQANIMAAEAALEKAQLNLSFTRITSPIDGIAGIAKAQIGNLVGPNSAEELTTISRVHPIKCYISVSEQEYMRMLEIKEKRAGQGKVPLELILTGGSVYPEKGEFAFADRQVDVRTGTIRVAGLFPNPKNLLRPGQFGRVRAEVGIAKGALVIPQRAVTEIQGKYMVAVVGPENKVAIRSVKAGAWFGKLWVIEEGLKAGEKVVAEGTQKVRDGMAVSPKPFGPEGQAASVGGQKPGEKPEGKPQPKPGKR